MSNQPALFSPITYILTFCFCCALLACTGTRISQERAKKRFNRQLYPLVFHQVENQGRSLHYASIGNDSLPVVVFLHESAESWNTFETLMQNDTLLTVCKMLSVDRPGFGFSDYRKPEPILERQSTALYPIIQQLHQQVILVGYGTGAALAARLTMDHPELIKGLLFLAPSLDPELIAEKWIDQAAYRCRAILPGDLRSLTEERISQQKELQKLLPFWAEIEVPVTVLHGDVDAVASYKNIDFLRVNLIHTQLQVITLPNMGHSILTHSSEAVKAALLDILSETAENQR